MIKAHDSQVAEQLIHEIDQADYLIADKGYDSERIRIAARNKNIVKNLIVIAKYQINHYSNL